MSKENLGSRFIVNVSGALKFNLGCRVGWESKGI